MTQSTFTFKQPTTIKILPVSESDNIRLMSPESGHPRFRRPIWPDRPDSGHLIGSGQKGWIPAIWPDLAREPDPGRPWPERPVPGRLWPERPDPGRQAESGQNGRLAERVWPDPARWLDSGRLCWIPAFISNSGYISRNQVKMVRILSVSD